MSFHTADYDTFVALGEPAAPPLWNWDAWQRFTPGIDPLIKVARGKASVRSHQFLPNRAGEVKFGRIGWKDADHQKWAHGSPTNKDASKAWHFMGLEIWAPAWTVCERDGLAPDVFLAIANESLGGGYGQNLLFNPVIVLAVVSELARRQRSEVTGGVKALRDLAQAKLLGYQRRPWGKAFAAGGFTKSIQDLAVSGLFKPGPRHKGGIGFDLFADRWEAVTLHDS
jgi:hypothetical protein